MTDHPPIIVWFRNDLRVSDNPALTAAASTGRPIIPLYVLDEREGAPPIGGAARWWLHGALENLAKTLHALGPTLVLRRGDPTRIISDLALATGARTVAWNERYEPGDIERDGALAKSLGQNGIDTISKRANLLHRPGHILTKSGAPYHVFTPFWRALSSVDPAKPHPAPKKLSAMSDKIESDTLDDWHLRPTQPDWASAFGDSWTIGEAEAQRKLTDFLDHSVAHYADERNRPDHPGTSRLSPHLHWGEISPQQIWAATQHHQAAARHRNDTGAETFLSELGWREFSHQLLFHHPDLPDQPMRAEFEQFPWREDQKSLRAWQQGRTGYPIVDAGMRQLWTTGWMHNRVRMIVASFLTKHVLQPWQAGAEWFMDTLVDADLAANSTNWQWVAGCGADAAPYFRIFNPILQGEKFDPDGHYVRQWVPELKSRPTACIHQPLASDERYGDYPKPIVEHAAARARALDAFGKLRKR